MKVRRGESPLATASAVRSYGTEECMAEVRRSTRRLPTAAWDCHNCQAVRPVGGCFFVHAPTYHDKAERWACRCQPRARAVAMTLLPRAAGGSGGRLVLALASNAMPP